MATRRKPADAAAVKKAAPKYRDRIVDFRRVPANELVPNPNNWRTHGDDQIAALRGALSEIGVIGAAIAYERKSDKALVLIDAHARCDELGTDPIPVLVVDLDEHEANMALATFDPLGQMAGADARKLDELLREVNTGDAALASMLSELAAEAGAIPADTTAGDGSGGGSDQIKTSFQILVTFVDEVSQARGLEDLTKLGYDCRSLIA
jgi:hypothetical protein